jgi:hypothetical protein
VFRDALAKNDNDDAHCSISSSSSSEGDTNMSFNFSVPNYLPISRLSNPCSSSSDLFHNNRPDPPTYAQQIAEPKNLPPHQSSLAQTIVKQSLVLLLESLPPLITVLVQQLLHH